MIIEAQGKERIAQVRELFAEYWESFGFTPCFQNFDDELAQLPGSYVPPGGRLAIARCDGSVAGCIALRPIDSDSCEVKRLYVRPGFRGAGLGVALVGWLTAQARSIGYKTMFAETMPVMQRALAMYERMGFERVDAYAEEATPGAVYLRLRLTGSRSA
ncbi:MAG TPA: GNAT family N-acetyltransferase [Candidatus Baltobacteraceae bacterium]|nr:GNAT family N-acetyltransferase [Candidatus Baltobacteraceae bacterium]